MSKFLRTQNTFIKSSKDKNVYLRGVNLGGWLMMEAYILHAPNYPEQLFKKNFAAALGVKALKDFETSFRSNFICEEDFKNIASKGFNCVRIPFNYRLIETSAYKYDKAGLAILDRALKLAGQNKLYVILDLHAAPGAQNHDWHSDSYGKAELWSNKEFQKRTYALWKFLADRYKDVEYLAGYDLLNEAVLEDTKLLNQFYRETIKSIRSVDRNHILFVEGSRWAQDIECLDSFDDDNYVLSIHNYEPLEFTFNTVPHQKYPLSYWNKSKMKEILGKQKKIAAVRKVPIYVGEFGVNARQGLYGEDRWLADTLSVYKEFGFHWTYWTYKAIKGPVGPDGVYSYIPNPAWVNRLGPKFGWDTFSTHWPKHRAEMIKSWQTNNFTLNKEVLNTLRKYI